MLGGGRFEFACGGPGVVWLWLAVPGIFRSHSPFNTPAEVVCDLCIALLSLAMKDGRFFAAAFLTVWYGTSFAALLRVLVFRLRFNWLYVLVPGWRHAVSFFSVYQKIRSRYANTS